jgi:hypothetical protein
VRFRLTGTRHFRNADRIVHLYNYLVTGAHNARRDGAEIEAPWLMDTEANADAELIGPFQVPTPLTLSVAEGHTLVDADGATIDTVVQPGTDFYLRPAPGTTATTLTATPPRELAGRVLTGVAFEGAPQRFTPIALTVPTDVAVEFDIAWQADKAGTEIEVFSDSAEDLT